MKGMADVAIVANCATHPHDPPARSGSTRSTTRIPYDWAVRHR